MKRGTTTKLKPKGGGAVMASRREAPGALDYFPTPPWATRALLAHVIDAATLRGASCWEPAAGSGHMAEPLQETFETVHASDVFDYGRGYAVGAFVAERVGLVDDLARCPFRPDWIITNPPFNMAEAFVARALDEARRGAAFLVRTSWLESEGRYSGLFATRPPSVVALFVERVPMVKGVWDPEASTATSYCWVVWDRACAGPTRLVWIPPGCKDRLTRPGDFARFARREAGMFDDATAPSGRLPERQSEGAQQNEDQRC